MKGVVWNPWELRRALVPDRLCRWFFTRLSSPPPIPILKLSIHRKDNHPFPELHIDIREEPKNFGAGDVIDLGARHRIAELALLQDFTAQWWDMDVSIAHHLSGFCST